MSCAASSVVMCVKMTDMLPIPSIGNEMFPEAKKWMDEGSHTKLYRNSPDDYNQMDQIWNGTEPDTKQEVVVVGHRLDVLEGGAPHRIRHLCLDGRLTGFPQVLCVSHLLVHPSCSGSTVRSTCCGKPAARRAAGFGRGVGFASCLTTP